MSRGQAGQGGGLGDQAAGAEGGQRSDQIRADIDRTRADMDETVNALQQRLQPEHLVNQSMGMIKGVAGTAGHALWGHMKQNPLPYALIGIGAIWLMSGKGTAVSAYGRTRRRHDGPQAEGAKRGYAGAGGNLGEGYAGSAESRSGSGAAGEGASGSQGGQRPQGQPFREAKGVRGKATAVASQAGHYASQAAHTAAEKARQAKDWTAHSLEEYPLVVGAAAFAAGLAAGLSIPISHRENELMGQKRDQLVDQAKQRGQDLVQRGKQVATSALEAAKDEAQAENLDPREAAQTLKEKGKRVVNRAKEAAREEAKRQDLTT